MSEKVLFKDENYKFYLDEQEDLIFNNFTKNMGGLFCKARPTIMSTGCPDHRDCRECLLESLSVLQGRNRNNE